MVQHVLDPPTDLIQTGNEGSDEESEKEPYERRRRRR
jgi:hypothetical protein